MHSDDYDREQWIADRRSFEAWRDDQRQCHDDEPTDERGNSLDGLFVFLADGYETGTLAARAVALLLFARPDLLGGDDYTAIAARLGVSVSQLGHTVRLFRESMPDFKGGYRPAQTSRNRLVSLAEIRSHSRRLKMERVEDRKRRRELHMEQVEAEACARKALARERVQKRQKRARDHAAHKRLEIARKTLAAWGILHAVEVKRWDDMERDLQELADMPRPSPVSLPPLDAFEIARREVLHRRGQFCEDEGERGAP